MLIWSKYNIYSTNGDKTNKKQNILEELVLNASYSIKSSHVITNLFTV